MPDVSCTHRRQDGDSAVLKHMLLDLSTWEKCLICGKVWKDGDGPMSAESVWQETGKEGGTGFLRKLATDDVWNFQSWKKCVTPPTTRDEAIAKLESFTKGVLGAQYAMIQCSQCHQFHGQGMWTGHLCLNCKEKTMKCSKCGKYTAMYVAVSGKALCGECNINVVAADNMKAAKSQPKGVVQRLPKANSPMWTTQWSVQGSGSMPYIISKRDDVNGSTTSEGFACSCPAFTRNTPREDCKHILKVRLFEGMSLTASKVAATVPANHAKEYAEFLKLKAQKERVALADGEIKMVGDSTGRKFR